MALNWLDEFGRPLHPYQDAAPVAKPAGAILVDGVQVADTLQCVHCGRHWIPQKGSGRVRGYCLHCQGPVCGPGCVTCVPLEQRFEQAERQARWLAAREETG